MKAKVHAILSAAVRCGCETLVLSAFGCGAFANPPTHVASLFRGAIEEHFLHSFKHISFSVIEDHNSWRSHNPSGNLNPFERVLHDLIVSPEEEARHELAKPDVEAPNQPREEGSNLQEAASADRGRKRTRDVELAKPPVRKNGKK